MGREFKTGVSQPALASATSVDHKAIGETIIHMELALNAVLFERFVCRVRFNEFGVAGVVFVDAMGTISNQK
jgi:hypothetical protein